MGKKREQGLIMKRQLLDQLKRQIEEYCPECVVGTVSEMLNYVEDADALLAAYNVPSEREADVQRQAVRLCRQIQQEFGLFIVVLAHNEENTQKYYQEELARALAQREAAQAAV